MRVIVAIMTVIVIALTAYPDAIVLAGPSDTVYREKTCSGDEPRFGAHTYFFGVSKPGLCITMAFYANTYGEALDCAQAMYPDCMVEDITSWYHFSSSIDDRSMKEGYCPQ